MRAIQRFLLLPIFGLMLVACGGGSGGGGETPTGLLSISPARAFDSAPQGSVVFNDIRIAGVPGPPHMWIEDGCPPSAYCRATAWDGLVVEMSGSDTPLGDYLIQFAAQYDDMFSEPSNIARAQVQLRVTAAVVQFEYTERHFDAGPKPQRIYIEDMNSDGDLDLVVGNQSEEVQFSVLLNLGDGTFGAPKLVEGGRNVLGNLALEDFNNDGHLDVGTFRPSETSGYYDLYVYFGDAAVEFDTELIGSFWNAVDPIAADLDADGASDIVASAWFDDLDPNKGIAVLYGVGDGAFVDTIALPLTSEPDGLDWKTVEDFNRDGILDLAASDGISLCILTGTGGRDFLVQDLMGLPGMLISPCDVNADGFPDIVSVYGGPVARQSLRVLLGDGSAGFTDGPNVEIGEGLSAAAKADFNGDGYCDFVLVGGTPAFPALARITVAENDRRGGFNLIGYSVPAGQYFNVAVADLNGDQVQDVVIASEVTDSVAVLLVQ